MCGIAGIISNNQHLVQTTKLQKMQYILHHRGPDDANFWINEQKTVGFAHTRLSIIDLSKTATQPMCYKLGEIEYWITYNGEIYNYIELRKTLEKQGYIFKTQSDTEVILAAYATYNDECVEYFDGMFAFAIWDSEHNEIFAARDRFGEKPFYYFFDGEQFVFASEIKAFWCADIPKQINQTQLLNYLAAGLTNNVASAEETFYQNIFQLPPASRLYYDIEEEDLTIEKYWQLDVEQKTTLKNEVEIVEKFQELFNNSVAKRLRSDVPVGTSLSGGLDSSSIIANIVQQHTFNNKPISIKTFSAVFPEFAKDESVYIKQVVQKFQLQNFTTTPTANDFMNDFEKLIYHQDEPFQSSSIYAQFKVYELAKQQGVKVLLDGQGADETLAGYTKYYHWYWQELFRKMKHTRLLQEKLATKKNGNQISWGIKNYAASWFPEMAAKQLSKKLTKQIARNDFLEKKFIYANYKEETVVKPAIHNLAEILYYNTFVTGLQDLLRYADRNSMAFGCEVRLPFLNHQLVEFIFSLPSDYKIRNGFTKYLLRKANETNLPQNIVWRKDKIGFEPPQQQWLNQKMVKEMVEGAKLKLIHKNILSKKITNIILQANEVHNANNIAWRVLCAANFV